MSPRRTPPCLTVRIPGKPIGHHTRNASAPAFGISTYSHRFHRTKVSQDSPTRGRCGSPRGSPDSNCSTELEDAAVAMAQVGSRTPSRLHPSTSGVGSDDNPRSRLIPISVGVHPPTPDPSSLPVSATPSPSTRRHSRSAESPDDRAVKQSRRVASIYSVTSSAGIDGNDPGSLYLRPDLTGASSLTLAQLPRTVSLEDLTITTPGDRSLSTTDAVEALSSDPSHCHSRRSLSSSSFAHSTASPSSPRLAPSLADSRLALAPHAAPPARQPTSLPDYISHRAPSYVPASTRNREVLGAGPGGRRETEADKLKRLYLCPWEGTAPHSVVVGTDGGSRPPASFAAAPMRSRSLRSRIGTDNIATSSSRDPEKGGSFEQGVADDRRIEKAPTRAEQRRKRLLVNLVVVFLAAVIFADLLVLNIRVFTGRDAYLSE
ncbi:hypothetical protein JCM11641_005752 [Rhodosporidiobolus odoratus]